MSISLGELRLCLANYNNPAHARALVDVLDLYARDAMGGSTPLSDFVRANLVSALAVRPHAFSVLAFDGADDLRPIGLANCLEGFSTFACRPLVNVHDLAVVPAYRGQGVGKALLTRVEQLARERGACKITLEVLTGNQGAMGLYAHMGFADYVLGPEQGHAKLMQKWLD